MQSATDRLIAAAGMTTLDPSSRDEALKAAEMLRARRDAYVHATRSELDADAESEGDTELNRVLEMVSTVDSLVAAIGTVLASGDIQRIAVVPAELNGLRQNLDSLIASEIEHETAERKVHAAEVDATVQRLRRVSLVLPMAAVFLTIFALLLITSRFHEGVSILLEANHRVAEGDLTAAVDTSGNDEFSQLFTGFNAMVTELRDMRRHLVDASRRAGMAEVAAAVLHNIGNVLNNVNVSVNMVQGIVERSKAPGVHRVSQLMQEHREDLAGLLTIDPRGIRLPEYIGALGTALDQEHRELLEEVASLRRDVEHISRIVEAQQVNASASAVVDFAPIAEVVESALSIAGVERAGIVVQREPSHLPAWEVDRHEVMQILVNVFTNARHAIQAAARTDGRVIVRVGQGNGMLGIAVEDNGIGIAPENITRIFQHGFTTRPGGRGFGLHSSANMAKALGGTLTGRSGGPGRGASFLLELPRMAQDRAA
jgi:signal transduction histidine kinase